MHDSSVVLNVVAPRIRVYTLPSRLSQGHNDYHKLITVVLSAQGGPLADSKSIQHDLDVDESLGD